MSLRIRNTAEKHVYARRGFTLVELMIAVLVLGIVMAMVGVIYKASGEAVAKTNATTEVQANLFALKQQITDDLKNIRYDGFLVLIRRDFDDLREETSAGQTRYVDIDRVRADRLLFWRTAGAETPQSKKLASKTEPRVVGDDAMVYYSHLLIHNSLRALGSTPPADAFSNHDDDDDTANAIVNRWAWGRQQWVYVKYPPVPAGDIIEATFSEYMKWATSGFDAAMSAMLRSQVPGSNSYMIPTLPRDGGNAIDLLSNNLYKLMLQHCGSVRIRMMLPTEDADHTLYAVAGGVKDDRYANWPPDDADGRFDLLPGTVGHKPADPTDLSNPTCGDDNGWLDLPEPTAGGVWVVNDTTRYPRPSGNALDDSGVVCFTPDCDTWPVALEFTIRLYDKNLSLTSTDDEYVVSSGRLGREHCGKTFRFVVELPKR